MIKDFVVADFPIKPVRKIPKNYLSVTGAFPSKKSSEPLAYESTLERDLYQLLDFDDYVTQITSQPVTIEYASPEIGISTYTPDSYVHYHKESGKKPMLVEVKYREDLRKTWAQERYKYKAAIRYANQRGWRFKILTDVEIRSDYLENAKYLANYINLQADQRAALKMISLCEQAGSTSPNEILSAMCHSKVERAELLPILWHLISTGSIHTDLSRPLTMKSEIWR